MKYIKTYESFKVNETMDMFTMPVDPIKGSLEVWSDIWDSVKSFFNGAKELFTEGLKKISKAFLDVLGAEEIIKKIEQYFRMPAGDLDVKTAFRTLMEKNKAIVENRERELEMQAHMDLSKTKDIGQKILSILQGIFAVNAFGGLVLVLTDFITRHALSFDLFGWAEALGLPNVMTNPGNRGFIPVWLILSLVAIGIVHLVKWIDAYVMTDKGTVGSFFRKFQ